VKIKLVPNKLDSFAKWEDPNLAVQQVENLVVEAFNTTTFNRLKIKLDV
jgi:hypothetical protein